MPNVKNSSPLFHAFIESDVFYLPQILSQIEWILGELRWKIWPDGIDTDEIKIVTYGNNADVIEKFRCWTLLQGDDSITKYYSKLGISKEYSLEDWHQRVFCFKLTIYPSQWIGRNIYSGGLYQKLYQSEYQTTW